MVDEKIVRKFGSREDAKMPMLCNSKYTESCSESKLLRIWGQRWTWEGLTIYAPFTTSLLLFDVIH